MLRWCGLAISDGPWNTTSTMKILWLLSASLGFLWVAGVEAYTLKERSLWLVDSEVGRYWCLRAILRKQDSLKEHIGMEVGDGRRCRVWVDPWLQMVIPLRKLGKGCFMMQQVGGMLNFFSILVQMGSGGD